MEVFLKILLGLHVSAGFISIVLFWLPILSKKGGSFHMKTGKLYVIAMWIVTTTAALLSLKNFILGDYIQAVFLGFLSLITSGPLWYAIAVLDQKKGRTPSYKKKLFVFNITVITCAIAMIIYGLSIVNDTRILMFIFGALGLTSIGEVIKHLRNKPSQMTWIQEHLVGMITTGIAAYTAFFVFGGRTFFAGFFPGYWAIIPWIAPGILGGIGNFLYIRKYAKKSMNSIS